MAADRKPYTAPSVAEARAMTAVLRIYAILRTNCDASGINWYGPQGVLRAVQLEVEKELDSTTREKLAAAGFDVRGETLDAPEHDPPWMRDPPTPRNTGTPEVCSCVNPPRLGIGETTCPGCGGSRAT